MTTAVDTNIFIAFWDRTDSLNASARSAIDSALARGSLVIAAPVYTELLAFPSRNEAFLDFFLNDTGILVDWNLEEDVWRAAGRAFQDYAARRRRREGLGPRRILADFLIGAHALRRGCRLLTLDDRLYRAAFPRLAVESV
ncbi:MAG TPA: PIN domain-containing protein [Candidatus Limnocylindrales bacterium]|nr:PIN domain-containing protein [Candidatus Limnocylindrales bacterium]